MNDPAQKHSSISRRGLIAGALGAGTFLGPTLLGRAQTPPPVQVPPPNPNSVVQNYGGANDPERTAPMLCVLSSNMAKVPWPEIGNIAQQLGFDGVDLTAYPGGHVEPEMIAVDLVRAFEVVRGAGISVPIVTTKINNLTIPNAFGIIALSGNAGVPLYRTGLWSYGTNPNVALRIQEIRRDLAQMVMGGQQYNIAAAVPNHTGGFFGGSIYDTQSVINDLPAKAVGYFYDVAQAVAVGPNDDWMNTLRLALPRLKAVGVSDFTWTGKGVMQPCPMGEGIVDWQKFYKVLAGARFLGPVSIQMDYKSGSDVTAMQKDLEFTRKQISAAYGLGAKS